MDGNQVFFRRVGGFQLTLSGGWGILSVTISQVVGGRLKLKSAVVGTFSGMYCRPNTLIEKKV